ncbi:hypothetical protein Poly59_25330 [Rubripirellula reticaptiva]|uniref:Uncharacterized protein n=1 Tax=Rubripirellula reticaptiva TaxID=2528013 RepID=A0A5C6F944_9BACT|nr:hypothetical protein Poly59_25330 [Rubripirellula reticaptiva]
MDPSDAKSARDGETNATKSKIVVPIIRVEATLPVPDATGKAFKPLAPMTTNEPTRTITLA